MQSMVPNKMSILLCALLLVSPASLMRIDMEVARKVTAIMQSKPPNPVALEQSEVRSAAPEGNEAGGETFHFKDDERTAAEKNHAFPVFKGTSDQAQKASDEWHAKHQHGEASTECTDKCRKDASYPDCTHCISKIYPGAWVQAQTQFPSTQQCHCLTLSGAEFVFLLAAEE